MEDIPETYQLETIEQMRALAEELRIRIIEALGRQAMTSKQLALLLGEVRRPRSIAKAFGLIACG